MASFGPNAGPLRLPLIGEYGSNNPAVKVAQIIIAAGDSGDSVTHTTSTTAGNQHAYAGGNTGLATAASDSNTLVNFFTDTAQSDTVDTNGPLDLVDFSGLGGGTVVGHGVVIKDLFVAVETAFTASVLMEIGDTADDDGWWASTHAPITSTSAGAALAPQWDTAADFAFRTVGGKYFSGQEADSEEVAMGSQGSQPDIAAGRLSIWINYFNADNLVYG